MKKIICILLTVLISETISAQSLNVQNMVNYLRSKDFEKAKVAADAAAIHDQTKGSAKMWMNRGKVYQAIYSDTSAKVRNIDAEAEEKALEAYINCLTIDKADNIYKEDVKGPLVQSCGATNQKANFYRSKKEYEKAIKCYDLLETAIPFDFDNGIKRANITKEKLLFYKYEMYKGAAMKDKTMEYANKLIEIKYKDPKIFTDMIKISLLDKDTAMALSYIDKGKIMFDDNIDIVNFELDIFLARKKTDILKEKLNAAIVIAPDNEVLHFVLGNVYKSTKNPQEAEKCYLKAIELKSDYEPAIYNLGLIYYDAGKDWNEKQNALPMKDPKAKEYEAKANENFRKAVGYFETSYEIDKDNKTKKILFQLYARLGETEKAAKYKQ